MAEEKKVVATEKSKMKAKDRGSLGKFAKETVVELKKVVWPTRKQLVVMTAVVFGVSALMAIYIAGFDLLFNYVDKVTLLKK